MVCVFQLFGYLFIYIFECNQNLTLKKKSKFKPKIELGVTPLSICYLHYCSIFNLNRGNFNKKIKRPKLLLSNSYCIHRREEGEVTKRLVSSLRET